MLQQGFSQSIRQRASQVKQQLKWLASHLQMAPVRVSACLRGGDCGAPVRLMTLSRGDILYGSRHISEWPHSKLLREYEQIGEAMWEPGVFERTKYYRSALANIEAFGNYFDAFQPDQIQWSARRFLSGSFPSHAAELLDSVPSWTDEPREHIAVRPILYSSCFQVVEGHHRLAALYFKGIEEAVAVIESPAVTTPLQDLLLETLSHDGRRELPQPIDAPEVRGWTVAQRSKQRLATMLDFLDTRGLMPPVPRSYLDVGCGYGWLVRQMADRGFDAEGVESATAAISVGTLINGLNEGQLHCSDAVAFLRSHGRESDVVSCCCLARQYLLHRHNATAEDLLRLLDTATRRVLFLDTSMDQECDQFEGWNPEQIRHWILDNTTFSEVSVSGKARMPVYPMGSPLERTHLRVFGESLRRPNPRVALPAAFLRLP